MAGTPATAEEIQAIQRTIAHLRARVAAGQRLRDSLTTARGSAIDADYRARHGQDLVTHGLAWMVSADGHLLTLAVALSSDELQAEGLYSLLRGAAEPLARLTWLFDDTLQPRQRFARLLAERLDNQLERRKLKLYRQHAEKRILQLLRLAKRAKLVRVPPTGTPAHFGERRPSATALFTDVLADDQMLTQSDVENEVLDIDLTGDPAQDEADDDADDEVDDDAPGELLYRLLSGHSHSAMHTFMSQAVLAERSGKVRVARIEINIFQLMTMLDLVMRMHDAAQLHWCRMYGADRSAWETARSSLPPTADLVALYRSRLRKH